MNLVYIRARYLMPESPGPTPPPYGVQGPAMRSSHTDMSRYVCVCERGGTGCKGTSRWVTLSPS